MQYPDKLYPSTVENRFHEILRKITACIIQSNVPNLARNMPFLENVNSAIEAEQHLFCRRLVIHNKIMAISCIIWWKKLNPFWQVKHSERAGVLPYCQCISYISQPCWTSELPKRIKLKVTMVHTKYTCT